MRRVLSFVVALVLVFTVFLAWQPASEAATVWKLGDRIVPGPLPPSIDAPMPELISKLNLSYGEHELQKLDFFRPKVCEGQTLPLVVYIHGGGFTAGDKSRMTMRMDSRLLCQLGFATASINYRLCPDVKIPIPVEDCKRAIRYLKANADELGIDPERIAIWGTSAGGHLVTILGSASEEDGLEGEGYLDYSSSIVAVVDHFGPTDMTKMIKHEGINRGFALYEGETVEEVMEEAVRVSPVVYASSDDPPLLILHGDVDPVVSYEQAEIMAKKCHEVGASVALVKVKNASHGFVPSPKDAEISPTKEDIIFMNVAHLARYIEPTLFGDLNIDGKVNMTDMFKLFDLIGMDGTNQDGESAPEYWNPLADLDGDGNITLEDWDLFWELL